MRLWGLLAASSVAQRPTSPSPPDKADQVTAAKEVLDVYKPLAALPPDKASQLAAKMVKEALAPGTLLPAHRFVMLREARDLAARNFDFALAWRASDELHDHFGVSAIQSKASALKMARKAGLSSDLETRIGDTGLTLVCEAIEDEEYRTAGEMLPLVRDALTRAKRSVIGVKKQEEALKELRAEEDKIKDLRKALAADPTNPEASLAVGKYQCFCRGDWGVGLPLLAAGADASLASLARKDLDGPDTPAGALEIGEGWWALAEKEKGLPEERLREHARLWLYRALPGLPDDSRKAVAQRLQRKLDNVTTYRPGLQVEWFSDGELRKAIREKVSYELTADWDPRRTATDVPAEANSARWHGHLFPAAAGRYTLTLESAAPARFLVDGQEILRGQDKGGGRYQTVLYLSPQRYSLRVEARGPGAARVYLGWSLENGFAERPVPAEALYHYKAGP